MYFFNYSYTIHVLKCGYGFMCACIELIDSIQGFLLTPPGDWKAELTIGGGDSVNWTLSDVLLVAPYSVAIGPLWIIVSRHHSVSESRCLPSLFKNRWAMHVIVGNSYYTEVHRLYVFGTIPGNPWICLRFCVCAYYGILYYPSVLHTLLHFLNICLPSVRIMHRDGHFVCLSLFHCLSVCVSICESVRRVSLPLCHMSLSLSVYLSLSLSFGLSAFTFTE